MVNQKWLNTTNSTDLYSVTSILIYPHHIKGWNKAVKISRRRASKNIPWYLLRHKTMITKGRDKTSLDISCCCKAVHLRTLEIPCNKQGTTDYKSPTKPRQMRRNNKNTGYKSGDPQGNQAVKCEHISQTKDFEGTPKSGSLEIVQIRNGWEASASKYPRCLEYTL